MFVRLIASRSRCTRRSAKPGWISGNLERLVSVSVPGVSATRVMVLRALVRGAVWVDNDPTEIVLKSFRGATGTTEDVNLITEKPGMELAVVKDECELVQNKRNPQGFDFVLEKQPDRGGQGHYKLKITVAPGKVFGQFQGIVVLEVKGPNPQRIRIPFKGGSNPVSRLCRSQPLRWPSNCIGLAQPAQPGSVRPHSVSGAASGLTRCRSAVENPIRE